MSIQFKYSSLALAVSALMGCASGGGSPASVPTPVLTASSASSAQSADLRHKFESFSKSYQPNLAGHSDVVQTFDMTEYTTSGLPSPTEKYKIADYGFFRSTIDGNHDGYDYGAESSVLNSYLQRGQVIRADLNGDDWQDFYLVMWSGDHDELEFAPDSLVFAFVNDGDGNFILKQDLFPDGNPCFRGSDCNNAQHNKGVLVADFNGDGIDDIFQGANIVLSNDNKLFLHTDKMPADLVEMCGDTFCFVHDAYNNDVDGDGDQDIFLPIASPSAKYNMEIPFTMLLNDGAGNFSMNQNFPDATDSMFATTAVIADFDNDGHGDVAVGWHTPGKNAVFSQQYNASSGAVFWNDKNNDWSKRPWTELPDNFYGLNGNANDMEVMDFNGDGFIDIVLASTKHDPYYDGRMVQFFQNNGDETFTDVTGIINQNTKYADGLGNGTWNGDGQLSVLDFDADGDLDVVDSVSGTYVLLNDNGEFTLYDDFPRFSDNSTYYPIEIDNKYFYDFIGGTYEYTDNYSVATLFQVLDPPATGDYIIPKREFSFIEMMFDITTKPAGFVSDVFNTAVVMQDFRYQTNGSKVFGKNINSSNLLGFNVDGDVFGFAGGNITGNIDGYFLSVDASYPFARLGVNYTSASVNASNKTKWYGTGTANVKFETLSAFIEKAVPINNYISVFVGGEVLHTNVNSFKETGSSFNVDVDAFNMNTAKLFADVALQFPNKLGTTFVIAGVDHYKTVNNTDINFAGTMTYSFDNKLTVGRLSAVHQYKMLYARLSADTEHNNSVEIGFSLTL